MPQSAFVKMCQRIAHIVLLVVFISFGIITSLAHLERYSILKKHVPVASNFFFFEGKASSLSVSKKYGEDNKAVLESLARKAISRAFGHVEALRVLGMLADENGNKQLARDIMELSANLSWRDSATQNWLLQDSIIAGNYSKSFLHADALLRRQKAPRQIFKVFRLAALEPSALEALKERFILNHDWRRIYFAQGGALEISEIAGFEKLALALQKTSAPVSRQELTPFVSQLFSMGEYRRGITLWDRLFPKDGLVLKRDSAALLNWPKNEAFGAANTIDWKFKDNRNLTYYSSAAPNEELSVLNLELGRSAIGEIARRNIIIPNGRLTLHANSQQAGPAVSKVIGWSLLCIGEEQKTRLKIDQVNIGQWSAEINSDCPVYSLTMELKPGGLTSSQTLELEPIRLSHQKL